MRIRKTGRVVAGAAVASVALLMGALSAPASAATTAAGCGDPGALCVWEGAFSGRTAVFTDLGDECVTLPFGVLADLNYTDRSVSFYPSTDCTGTALVAPSLDLHSWVSHGAMHSFRAS
ncbi:hypothetical protein SRB5_46540 [Streptomyces sp. RB5]|uniref:Peptidase inhibitor family I36 n=1 Tax=Streptomyces smaragdinus TaxID=2585196 RepID=A0A7K0CLX9_9ACTN|nr:hypothetical protein [Streptomyces smaragdinus]MQY14487.1 hypothetical protein [Streptomyces smaragdinus]